MKKASKTWMQSAVKQPGAFTAKAKAVGMSVQQYANKVLRNKEEYSSRTVKQASLAKTFSKLAQKRKST